MIRLIAQVPRYIRRESVSREQSLRDSRPKKFQAEYLRYLEGSGRRHPALEISRKFYVKKKKKKLKKKKKKKKQERTMLSLEE